MAFVVSLTDYTPSPRYPPVTDGWVSARIEEAPASTGPWTALQTIPLLPLDANPALPATRSFTTELATIPTGGWYRVVFLDASGDQQQTAPVTASAVPGLPIWAPSTGDVARLVGAYAREHVGGYAPQAGRERDAFTNLTVPTIAQVGGYVAEAVNEVKGRVGLDTLPAHVHGLARTAALWHAAAQVEAKRMPAQTDDASGSYRAFISNFTASMRELVALARSRPSALSNGFLA